MRDSQPIEGADQDTYTATAQDSGKNLQFRVTPAAATGQSPGAAAVSSGITIENSAPVVTVPTLRVGTVPTLTTGVGSELSVVFSYSDVDSDAADAAKIRWLRNSSTSTVPIPNATGSTYTVAPADLGSFLVAEVTPQALKGVLRGAAVSSPPVSVSVSINNSAPVAQNVELKATLPVIIGSTLTASYTYFDADGDAQATSTFRWLRNGTAITGATGRNYTLTLADAGKTIAAEVTPLALTGTLVGLPVSSSVAVASANVALTVSAGLKQLRFSWAPVPGASLYKVSINPDGVSEFVPVSTTSSNIIATTYDWDIGVHRINWPKAQFMLEACDALNTCLQSASISALSVMVGTIGYFKASNTGKGDYFGYSVALSADGSTLAVAAYREDSAATGVGGDPADGCAKTLVTNCASNSGAVYVYTRANGTWLPQPTYIKASNTGANDGFGVSVALSANGNTLAVGTQSGAVYVYTRASGTWSQPNYVKTSNTEARDEFGYSVALSADGNTLAVGAPRESSAATGIGGDPANGCAKNPVMNCSVYSGAVYVYILANGIWLQTAYVKASNTGAGALFGYSLALAADGNTLAVGAIGENSPAAGVGGNQTDGCAATPVTNCVINSGAVYVYARTSDTWQPTYVKASHPGAYDHFGDSVALSADGNTLAVGASGEDSAATGVGGDPADGCSTAPVTNCASNSGAAYVYTRTNNTWLQPTYVKASNVGYLFGRSVALSADGNTLAVGAWSDNSLSYAGAVYVYAHTNGSWSQQTYVKASNAGASDLFGFSVALTADGNTLAVGAIEEDSAATGVNNTMPGQSDNSAVDAGAVYLY